MDEQRLNEIAKSAAVATIDTVFHLPDTMDRFRAILEESAYRAARESLSSQEEDLAFMREAVEAACKDRDYYEQQEKAAESRYQEEYRIVARVWVAVRGGEGYKGEEISGIVVDYVKRAETAEAEVRSLREERDGLKAQISGVGIVPYLDRMKELAEARDTERQNSLTAHEEIAALRQLKSDLYVHHARDVKRAESAEVELLRLREGMREKRPVEAIDYDSLDSGIRDIVKQLREAGFETTDSGDGVSKPVEERAFDCLHVAAVVRATEMIPESRRFYALLGADWHVEATYFPQSETTLLLGTLGSVPQVASERDAYAAHMGRHALPAEGSQS